MNSTEFIKEFKCILDDSCSHHVEINEAADRKLSEGTSQTKEEKDIELNIDLLQKKCEEDIINYKKNYEFTQERIGSCKNKVEAARKKLDSELQKQTSRNNDNKRIKQRLTEMCDQLLTYISAPNDTSLIFKLGKFDHTLPYDIIPDMFFQGLHRFDLLEDYPQCFQKDNSMIKRELKKVRKDVTYKELNPNMDLGLDSNLLYLLNSLNDYVKLFNTIKGRIAVNRTVQFKKVVQALNYVFAVRNYWLSTITDEYVAVDNGTHINEAEEELRSAEKELAGIEPMTEEPAHYEERIRENTNSEIFSLMAKLRNIRDSEISNRRKKVRQESEKLHNEEAVLLRERLDLFDADKIKNFLKYRSILETTDDIRFFKCPEEFNEYFVVGKVSFDYSSDSKIGAFSQIVDTVDDFFKDNHIRMPKKGAHYIFEIPLVISWDDFDGLNFVYNNESREYISEAYKSVLIHLIADSCPGSMIFTMIDGIMPAGLFAPFTKCVKTANIQWLNNRIYNDPANIDAVLEQLNTQVTSGVAAFPYKNIIEANKELVSKKPINLICIAASVESNTQLPEGALFDIPMSPNAGSETVSQNALNKLSKIIRNGKKMGYYCLSMTDSESFTEEIYSDYKGVSVEYDDISEEFFLSKDGEQFTVTLFPYPNMNDFDDLADNIADSYENMSPNSYNYVGSKIQEVLGQNAKAIENISVAAAYDTNNHICNFILDNKNINYLVLGNPGMGKSCFIHTIINNMLRKYSPNDLSIYLMSYKADCCEIDAYSEHFIPHIRLVNKSKSAVAFLKILDKILQENKRRDGIFAKNPSGRQFNNYNDYMNAYYSGNTSCRDMKHLPRIVVFIDEIQEIIGADKELNDEIQKKLSTLFNTARCFGVHIIISTQKLDNLTDNGMSLSQLKGMRKVLFTCLNGDVDALLSDGSAQDAKRIKQLLNSIPGHAFMIRSNHISEIIAPHFAFDREAKHLEELSTYYRDCENQTFVIKDKMFDGIDNQYADFVINSNRSSIKEGVLIGEEIIFDKEQRTYIRLEDLETDNIMLVGDDVEVSNSIITSAYLSLLGDVITSNAPVKSEIIFANFNYNGGSLIIDTHEMLSSAIKESGTDRLSLRFIPCGNISEDLYEMLKVYADRLSSGNMNDTKVYLFLNGIHNTDELDEFMNSLRMINEKLGKFIHLIVWSDNRANMEDFLAKTAMSKNRNFKYRIAFSSEEMENVITLGHKDKIYRGTFKLKSLGYLEDPIFVPYDFSEISIKDSSDMISRYVTALRDIIKKTGKQNT